MRIRRTLLISLILFVMLVGYLFFTPIGALRLAVAREGYLINAITLQLADKPYHMSENKNEISYTIINPPYEKETESNLQNWLVTRYLILYVGRYYGWA